MLSIRLDRSMEKSLEDIANFLQQPKSTLIREALAQYIEDRLDYFSAVKAMKKMRETYSLDEVLEEFKDELQN